MLDRHLGFRQVDDVGSDTDTNHDERESTMLKLLNTRITHLDNFDFTGCTTLETECMGDANTVASDESFEFSVDVMNAGFMSVEPHQLRDFIEELFLENPKSKTIKINLFISKDRSIKTARFEFFDSSF